MRLRPAHVIPMLVLFTAGCKVTSVTQPSSAPVGSLGWRVQQAKAKGETKVGLVELCYMADEGKLDQALQYTTIVTAVPVASAVQVEPDTILTWHKFKVSSDLSEAKTCGLPCNPAPNPPLSLLPLAHDEIAIPFEGGTVEVDGVTVTVSARRPNFRNDEEYTLFLDGSAGSNQVFFLAGGGGQWAFRTDKQGTVYHESGISSRLSKEVLSLRTEQQLRKHIQALKSKPPAGTKN
jgi:hypothetical protein